MSSLRRHEGYLLIDLRNSPGVPTTMIRAAAAAGHAPAGSGQGLFESATVTCAHCHAVVVLNPDRQRPRHYCARCDHYVCDHPQCATQCQPLNAVIDRLRNAAARALAPAYQVSAASLTLPPNHRKDLAHGQA
jgi:hypothetical protein